MSESRRFCADCGIEFFGYETIRRKNEKGIIQWICLHCVSKYQY